MTVDKVQQLLTDNIDLWTGAIEQKSSAGRGNKGKKHLYGIKKLRELILELAVRGKLVPQDASEEPASELLKRIATERERWVKEKKIKKPKKLPEIEEEEKPLDILEGWGCCRLGEVLNVLNGRAYKKHEMLQSGTPLLRVGNLFTSNQWYYSDLELEPEKYIDNEDLIYAWSASFGPFIWNGGKAIYHYHIWKLDFFDPLSLYKPYVYNFLLAITEEIKASGNGIAMIHMTKERMEKVILRIPPLAEQHRIVAKVDELMALCDQLEQQTEQQLDAHQLLVDTLLGTLTQSQNADELADNWARLSQHFDTLFTTVASIDHLKQTILQLAVMGKLVPQNPDDEPAFVLFERIAAEKAQLIKEKKIKKQKQLPPITEEEKPHELPKGWEWIRTGDAGDIKLGRQRSPKDHSGPYMTPYLRVANVHDNQIDISDVKEMNFTPDEQQVFKLEYGDILLNEGQSKELVGRPAMFRNEVKGACFQNTLLRFRAYDGISREYALLYFRSCLYSGRFQRAVKQTTNMAHLSASRLIPIEFPLPPQESQQRIVSKVNELFTLCDQLKKQLQQNQHTQLLLTDTLVQKSLK